MIDIFPCMFLVFIGSVFLCWLLFMILDYHGLFDWRTCLFGIFFILLMTFIAPWYLNFSYGHGEIQGTVISKESTGIVWKVGKVHIKTSDQASDKISLCMQKNDIDKIQNGKIYKFYFKKFVVSRPSKSCDSSMNAYIVKFKEESNA